MVFYCKSQFVFSEILGLFIFYGVGELVGSGGGGRPKNMASKGGHAKNLLCKRGSLKIITFKCCMHDGIYNSVKLLLPCHGYGY